jgi:hypothetical protein
MFSAVPFLNNGTRLVFLALRCFKGIYKTPAATYGFLLGLCKTSQSNFSDKI